MKLEDFNIKLLVKDNFADFSHYRAGHLYYSIIADQIDGLEYVFPVPLDTAGEATFSKTEKAIFLMSYIRKALKEGSFVPKHPRN